MPEAIYESVFIEYSDGRESDFTPPFVLGVNAAELTMDEFENDLWDRFSESRRKAIMSTYPDRWKTVHRDRSRLLYWEARARYFEAISGAGKPASGMA
jgi:hypothetical protein